MESMGTLGYFFGMISMLWIVVFLVVFGMRRSLESIAQISYVWQCYRLRWDGCSVCAYLDNRCYNHLRYRRSQIICNMDSFMCIVFHAVHNVYNMRKFRFHW